MLKALGSLRVTKNNQQARFYHANARQETIGAISKYTSLAGASGVSTSSGGGYSMTGVGIANDFTRNILEGFIGSEDVNQINRICRDIYRLDPICGSAVDLLSNLPFSDFVLSGAPSVEMLKVYVRCVESVQLKMLSPEITRDHYVFGRHISVLNFDSAKKTFTSIMPIGPDMCKITPVPSYGIDPLVDIKIPKELTRLINQNDPRLGSIRDVIPNILEGTAGAGGYIPIEPMNLIFLPRRTLSTESIGESLFLRVIPIYLYEKALARGTIEAVHRRQRGILHITMGDGSEYIPTDEELSNVVNLFISADVDPMGAIVGTRENVNVSEVRNGGDFFRWDEIYDLATTMKLKALNINESFLSGDQTYSTMDAAMSVFIEQMRAYREFFTRKILTNKLFLILAATNGFVKTNTPATQVVGSYSYSDEDLYSYKVTASSDTNTGIVDTKFRDLNPQDYLIPNIQWIKSLRPESDQAYFDTLRTMQELGLPITLRMVATAAGQSLPEITQALEQDVKDRKVVDAYKKRLPGSAADVFASMQNPSLSAVNRDFSQVEAFDPKTRKTLTKKGRAIFEERANRNIAAAAARVAVKENYKVKKEQEALRERSYSFNRKNKRVKRV